MASQSSSLPLPQTSAWLPTATVGTQAPQPQLPWLRAQAWLPAAQIPGLALVQAWVLLGVHFWQSLSSPSVLASQSSSLPLPQTSAWLPGLIWATQGPHPLAPQVCLPAAQGPGNVVWQLFWVPAAQIAASTAWSGWARSVASSPASSMSAVRSWFTCEVSATALSATGNAWSVSQPHSTNASTNTPQQIL